MGAMTTIAVVSSLRRCRLPSFIGTVASGMKSGSTVSMVLVCLIFCPLYILLQGVNRLSRRGIEAFEGVEARHDENPADSRNDHANEQRRTPGGQSSLNQFRE